MAIRLISFVMAVSAFFSTGASAVTKAHKFYAQPAVGDVFDVLDSNGIGTKTTILMGVNRKDIHPSGE